MPAAAQFALAAVGPELRSRYALSVPQLGVLFSVYLLANGLALIPAGAAVDRFGARAVTLAGGVIAAGGLAAAALAPTRPALFAGLAGAGIGAAVVPVTGSRVVFAAYDAGKRAWAFGVRQTAVPLGGLAAVAIAPTLVEVGGPAALFAVLAASTAASSAWLLWVAPARDRPTRSRVGRIGAVWRARGMRRLFVVATLYVLVLQTLLVYTVPAARSAGFSAGEAQLVYLAVTISAVVSRIFWGRLADRGHERRRILAVIGIVAATGACLFAVALSAGPVAGVAAAAFFAFGAFGWNAIVYVAVAEGAPDGVMARSLSIVFAIVFVVSAAGTPLFGLLGDRAGWTVVWAAAAVLSTLGAIAASASSRTPTLRFRPRRVRAARPRRPASPV